MARFACGLACDSPLRLLNDFRSDSGRGVYRIPPTQFGRKDTTSWPDVQAEAQPRSNADLTPGFHFVKIVANMDDMVSFRNKRFTFFSQHDFNLYRFRLPVMRALVERGAKVWAVSPPGEYSAHFQEHGIGFVPIALDRKTFNPLKAWNTVRQLARILQDLQPDLLHTSTLRPNAYGALAGWLTGVPVIVGTVEGLGTLYTNHDPKTRMVRWGVERITRLALRAADAVIFLNPDDREYYISHRLCRPEQARLIV
ncbi:MAG: glycosyltransferase, partial [Candidatus Methanomethyliaceae archaeon]